MLLKKNIFRGVIKLLDLIRENLSNGVYQVIKYRFIEYWAQKTPVLTMIV